MKVVKKVASVVCMCVAKVLHYVAVACSYVSDKAQAASDSLDKE